MAAGGHEDEVAAFERFAIDLDAIGGHGHAVASQAGPVAVRVAVAVEDHVAATPPLIGRIEVGVANRVDAAVAAVVELLGVVPRAGGGPAVVAGGEDEDRVVLERLHQPRHRPRWRVGALLWLAVALEQEAELPVAIRRRAASHAVDVVRDRTVAHERRAVEREAEHVLRRSDEPTFNGQNLKVNA